MTNEIELAELRQLGVWWTSNEQYGTTPAFVTRLHVRYDRAHFPEDLVFQETGDRSVLWPAHFAGRRREYCQIERLSNLDALPAPFGFTLSCFPVKIVGAGAGWARAVAMVED